MKRASTIGLLLLGCGLLACGQGKPDESAPAPGVDPNLRIGHVMVEVGHRFETAGRASQAGSWGLAEYQVQEILEMFNMDMTRSALPGDCNDAVSDQMYGNLLDQLPTLQEAAENEDADAFAEQFATASGNCNGCHAGCNVPFIRVPSVPGMAVPIIEAPGTEAAGTEAAGTEAAGTGAAAEGESDELEVAEDSDSQDSDAEDSDSQASDAEDSDSQDSDADADGAEAPEAGSPE